MFSEIRTFPEQIANLQTPAGHRAGLQNGGPLSMCSWPPLIRSQRLGELERFGNSAHVVETASQSSVWRIVVAGEIKLHA